MHTQTKKRGISTPLPNSIETKSIAQTKAKLEGLVWGIEWNIFQLGLYVLHRGRNLKWELANRIKLAKDAIEQGIVEAVEYEEAAFHDFLQVLWQHDAGAAWIEGYDYWLTCSGELLDIVPDAGWQTDIYWLGGLDLTLTLHGCTLRWGHVGSRTKAACARLCHACAHQNEVGLTWVGHQLCIVLGYLCIDALYIELDAFLGWQGVGLVDQQDV